MNKYMVYFYDYNRNVTEEQLTAEDIYAKLADGMYIESFTIDGVEEWTDIRTRDLDADKLNDWVIAQSSAYTAKHNQWDIEVIETPEGWYAVATHAKYGEIDTRDAMPKRDSSDAARRAIAQWADDVEADPALQ